MYAIRSYYADCLHALSVFQGCEYARVSFSVRVRADLPAESGFLEGAPLVAALLDELRRQPADSGWQGMQGRLLRLLADLLPQSSLRRLSPLGALAPELRPVLAYLMAPPAQYMAGEPQTDRLTEPFRATLRITSYNVCYTKLLRLFISNHRDIAMDPAFVNWGLHTCGLETVRIAIGDNLLRKPCATELMRLNKSFIVKRSAKGPREMARTFSELSAYIAHSLEEGHSIWIAQKEGRAKDGDDRRNNFV